jgi:hypothetical protein
MEQMPQPQRKVLVSSSGEDGFSVYWKLIVIGDCLKTNEVEMIKQQFSYQSCSFWGGDYHPKLCDRTRL